jgi:hypothetical protein
MVYAIDIESFYDADLNVEKLGAINYLGHPDGDIYLLAVAGSDGFRWTGRPEKFNWQRLNGAHVIAHNASFEKAFFQTHPQIPRPALIDCTASLAAWSHSGRSLKVAAKKLLGLEIDKAPRDKMKGRSWEVLSEAEHDEMAQYCLSDAERCLQLWEKYSGQWPEAERELARMTVDMGLGGIYIDNERLDSQLIRAREILSTSGEALPWDAPHWSNKKAALHCATIGIPAPGSFAMKSPERQIWEKDFAEHDFIHHLSDGRRANQILKKLQTMKRRIMPNGRLCFDLKYGGTHTMRWAGGGGLNLQNLHKEPWMGLYLRELLIPEPGKIFIVADLSQIEPRVLAWMVGDETLLALIREGYGVYEAMAKSWGTWDGPAGTLKKTDPFLYAFMKSMTLGCGYGLGWRKFRDKCEEIGISIMDEEAQKRVALYRQRNPKVVQLWARFDRELEKHLLKGGMVLHLPSGRNLHYPQLRRRRAPAKILKDPRTGKITLIPERWETAASVYSERGEQTISLWGGVLTENACQSLARDVFAAGLLRLNRAGIRVVLHAHDEVLCEVEPGTDPKEIERLLTISPDWAPNLPLAAEAKILDHYAK